MPKRSLCAAGRQHCKRRELKEALATLDVMTLSETHGSDHVEVCWEPPAGFTCFWSHGTSRRAGIGLVVIETWLS
jgi:hypothetical protein